MGFLNFSNPSEKVEEKMGSLSADWSGFLSLVDVCCQEEECLMAMKSLAQKDLVCSPIPEGMMFVNCESSKIDSGFSDPESRALNVIVTSGFTDKESGRVVNYEGLKRKSGVDGSDEKDSEANLLYGVSGSFEQEHRKNHNEGLKRKSSGCDSYDGKDLTKKKKRKYMMKAKGLSHPCPGLPEEYKRLANGAEAKLVIQKQLFPTDVQSSHGRLSLPPKQVVYTDFLRANEMESLYQRNLTVPLIDPTLKEEVISLSLWKLSDSNERRSLVLNTTWNKIVKKNSLAMGDLIQVWSFRDNNDQLHLALVVVKEAENGKIGKEAVTSSATSTVSNGFEGTQSTSHSHTSHTQKKCLKIRFKLNGSRVERIGTTSQVLCN